METASYTSKSYPKFGALPVPGTTGQTVQGISDVNGLFDQLAAAVAKNSKDSIALANFYNTLQQTWGVAYCAMAGKIATHG